MNAIFLRILNLGLQASFMICFVVLLRFVLKKSPKWIHCLMWGLVAIRLVCPINIESSFSLTPRADIVSMNAFVNVTEDHADSEAVKDFSWESIYHQETDIEAKKESAAVLDALSFVWLAGMIMITMYTLAGYLKIRRRVSTSVKVRDNIFISDKISSPFIMNFLKPRIYLPIRINEEQMESVIAHEKAHIKRCDHIWKLAGFILLIVYWFNPLCWLAYILLCRDIELACDEKVIKDMSMEQKKKYSMVLLSFSESRKLMPAYPLAFGEVGVKERIGAILSYKKPAIGIIIAAVLAVIITSVLFLTNKKEKSTDSMFTIGDLYYGPDTVMSDNYSVFNVNDLKTDNYEEISDLKYEFEEYTVEPRGYIFDGNTMYFSYDLVGEREKAKDIIVKDKNTEADTTYYIMNGSEERSVLRAIIYCDEYRKETDLVISNGTDTYDFHAVQNAEQGKYTAK